MRALSLNPRLLTATSRSYGTATKLEGRAHTRSLSLLRATVGSEIAGEGSPNVLRFKNLFVEFTEANYIPSYILLYGKYTDSNYPKEEMHKAKSMRVLKAKFLLFSGCITLLASICEVFPI